MIIEKEIVIPGDFLSDDPRKAGRGTYVEGGKVYALTFGIFESRDKMKVIPLGGKYIPAPGDTIIGNVVDHSLSSWKVDVNSPYRADLHLSEFPERVDYGEMDKYIKVGDSIIATVVRVDDQMRVDLTLKGYDLKVLRGGRIIDFFHSKIPRLIGRSGSMIKMLKEESKCAIFVGQNGRIWVKGDDDNMALAVKTIKKIEDEAHTSGLTAKIAQFLKDEKEMI